MNEGATGPVKKYIEERPWGKFERFTKGEASTVKIITVNPNQELSLQLHHNREEFWRVVDGAGQVTVGETVAQAKEGDEFYIDREVKHRLAGGVDGIRVLEIAFGDFDEGDIIRLEDKYRRS